MLTWIGRVRCAPGARCSGCRLGNAADGRKGSRTRREGDLAARGDRHDEGGREAAALDWTPVRDPAVAIESWRGILDIDEVDAPIVADLPTRRERLRRWLGAAIAEEARAGSGFVLATVPFALGIIIYFTAPIEPDGWATGLLVLLALTAIGWRGRSGRAALVALALLACGFGVAKARTAWLDTPMVSYPTVGTLTGEVVWTERRAGGSVRYTVRVAAFTGRAAHVPRLVRVVDRKPAGVVPPGREVRLRARFVPPSGPAVPGGYDFAFHDWFAGRGAIGSVLGRPDVLGQAERNLVGTLAGWRFAIGERIAAGMPEDTAPLARALVIGDRSGIEQETAEELRMSGLAHILAISGLHMMLVTGLVYLSLRKLAAFASAGSLRWPVKKWAALGALASASIYLALSGMNVSTQRAFVMVSIMLAAVLLDRQAVTMRNVAIAAFVVLAWQPEALFAPGFQMSFAAAAALVACYAELQRRNAGRKDRGVDGRARSAAKWLGGLSLTSVVAGFATAPFAAFHFHRIALLSLVGNLLAMPVVTFLVMPLAVLGVVAMPLGLDPIVLPMLGWSLDLVGRIAAYVASYDLMGRTGRVPMAAFALSAAGFCALVMLRSRLRLAGLVPLTLAFAVPGPGEVVAVINENGRNVSVLEPDRLVHSAGRAESFTNRLVADAFPRARDATSFRCDTLGCAWELANGDRIAMSKRPRSLRDDCRLAAVLVARSRVECPTGASPLIVDGPRLRRRGSAMLLRDGDGGYSLSHAYGERPRPWTRHRFAR